MFHAMPVFSRVIAALGALLLCSCALSQPAPTTPRPAPVTDGKTVAEKIIRPNNGALAIVLDEKGQAIVVNKNGQAIQPCQVCTPDLERRYGPQCAKAQQLSEKPGSALATPQICTKLMGTNVQGVKPITVLRHTGSQCMTIFLDSDGSSLAFEYCWE